MRAPTRPRRAALFALCAVALTPGALAQPRPPLTDEEVAQRRLLLEQARASSDAGAHAEALDALLNAARIRSSSALQQFIAAEHQSLHHYADGLRAAARCIDEAVSDPTTRNRDDQMRTCRALLEEMRTHVGYVVVQAPSPAPDDLVVTLGNSVIPRSFWGSPHAVDPGTLPLRARAAGYDDVQTEVTVTRAQTTRVPVDLRLAAGMAGQPIVGQPMTGYGLSTGQPVISNCGELGQACCVYGCNQGIPCNNGTCSVVTTCDETHRCGDEYACEQRQCVYRPRTRRFVVGASADILVDVARENGATGFLAGPNFTWRPLVWGTRTGWELAGLVGASARFGTWRDSFLLQADLAVGVSARVGVPTTGLYTALWYNPGLVYAETKLTHGLLSYRADLGVYVNRVTVSVRWQGTSRDVFTPAYALSAVVEVDL